MTQSTSAGHPDPCPTRPAGEAMIRAGQRGDPGGASERAGRMRGALLHRPGSDGRRRLGHGRRPSLRGGRLSGDCVEVVREWNSRFDSCERTPECYLVRAKVEDDRGPGVQPRGGQVGGPFDIVVSGTTCVIVRAMQTGGVCRAGAPAARKSRRSCPRGDRGGHPVRVREAAQPDRITSEDMGKNTERSIAFCTRSISNEARFLPSTMGWEFKVKVALLRESSCERACSIPPSKQEPDHVDHE